MPPPEPPRRGLPLGRITELNQATAPHTPVPPPDNNTAVTARPPADPRPPPRQYAPRPMVRAPSVEKAPAGESFDREDTAIGPSPVLAAAEPNPDEGDRPSVEMQLAQRSAELASARADLQAALQKPAPAPTPSLVTPAAVEKYERTLERRGHKLPSDTQLKPLVLKLVAALTGLVIALTTSAELLNQYVKWKLQGVEAKQDAQEVVLKPAAAAAKSAVTGNDACREYARAWFDYDRQIWLKQGVVIPLPENYPPVTEIKTRAAVHKPNAITGAPILEVLTPPPALP